MKNDPEFNIEFVQLIEKYPILYNFTLAGYSNKTEVERAWNEIGKSLNETGTACQEKWRILRGGFNRYIKKKEENTSTTNHKKPYYLAKYMEFLTPYLKSRIHNNHKISEENLNGFPTEPETEITEDDLEQESIFDHCEVVLDERVNNNEFINKSDDLDFVNVEKIKVQKCKRRFETNSDCGGESKKYCFSEENPDYLFMKSLLPDMAQLDKRDKMKFKIQILNILNHLLYNETTVSTLQLSP